MHTYDVVIVGCGPGGATAALYAARAGLSTLIIDKSGMLGSLERSEHIANFPGVPGPVKGEEVLSIIRQQAVSFGAECRNELVIGAELAGGLKQVFTSEGGVYAARAVILAGGALERTSKIPGEEEYLGRGVSTCATCDAAFYRGKRVAIVGKDEFAAEECLKLADFAEHVYFTVPAPALRVSPERLAELQAHPGITIALEWTPREILGNERVTGARYATKTGEEILSVDGAFLFLGGAKPSTGFLYGQVACDDQGAVTTDETGATSVPNVYAVGDIRANHIRQAVIAASEGCVAALAVEKALRNRGKVLLDYK